MSIFYIRDAYGVPAKRGMCITYWGGDQPVKGRITGTQGDHLMIMLDGAERSLPFHPTWMIEYPPAARPCIQ